MSKPLHRTSSILLSRRGAFALGLACSLAVLAAPSVQGQGKGDPDDAGQRVAARAEIEALEYCYAAGTDAIGRGELASGRATYKDCFTADAAVEVFLPGSDPDGTPDLAATGPVAWADAVDAGFAAVGYVGTQHMITNVRISLDGDVASVESYLQATHVADPAGTADVALGTYESVVVRTPKGWRIAARTLRLLAGLRHEAP